MNLNKKLSHYSDVPISTPVLLNLLKDYKRPYDKIGELVNQGVISQLRKGLYLVESEWGLEYPEPFLIANHLYGPSYISLDSALFYWGMIPERVFEITSVTIKKSKKYRTGNLYYNFIHLPSFYYPLGIQSLPLTEKQNVLIASPEKSLCDKIITTAGINLRSRNQTINFLVEDLRIEKYLLRELNIKKIQDWLPNCPKQKSIQMLIHTIADI